MRRPFGAGRLQMRRACRVVPGSAVGMCWGREFFQERRYPQEFAWPASGGGFMAMDLTVTVETAMTFLGAVLSTSTWTRVARTNPLGWSGQGRQCPWCDSVRLFRQQDATSWQVEFATVAFDLMSIM